MSTNESSDAWRYVLSQLRADLVDLGRDLRFHDKLIDLRADRID